MELDTRTAELVLVVLAVLGPNGVKHVLCVCLTPCALPAGLAAACLRLDMVRLLAVGCSMHCSD